MLDREERRMKTYFILVVEYLRWNERYRRYCQTMRRKRRHALLSSSRSLDSIRLRSLYTLFGNIHSKSFNFEQWWDANREFLVSKTFVHDFKTTIRRKLERIVDKIRATKKRDPSLEEFIEYFVDYLNSTPELALIEIDLRADKTAKGLFAKVKDLIATMRKTSSIEEYTPLLSFPYYRPPHHFRPDHLEQNLRIYSYRKKEKLSWREIAEKHIEEEYTANLRRRLEFQFNNARIDVENIVTGHFPSHQEKLPPIIKRS